MKNNQKTIRNYAADHLLSLIKNPLVLFDNILSLTYDHPHKKKLFVSIRYKDLSSSSQR